ncbi:MAG: KEOPS complex kinase/ATPase Bud32 [Candidatus Ranarchaeia archaeon]
MNAIVAKGAEAILTRANWHGQDVIIKERTQKKYRLKVLDYRLRRMRTRQEAKLLNEARNVGVSTPFVYLVDLSNTRIIMDFIEGRQLKTIIPDLCNAERKAILYELGNKVAILHQNNIIHGDLTTSNFIITKTQDIYFIDFGLGLISVEVEQKGVDLHLFQRTLASTHHIYYDECLKAFLEGYSSQYPEGEKIIQRLWTIDARGRYIKKEKRKPYEKRM